MIASMSRSVSRVAMATVLATACNQGLAPTAATARCPGGFIGVCGTVSFRGTLPDSTDAIFIVAYDTFPTAATDLFKFKPVPPPTIPLGGAPYAYTLSLPTGRYAWIVAVWKKIGVLTAQTAPNLLEEAGFYRDPADTTKPGVVSVNGTGTDSIDFVIDFGNLHRICTYFPPC